MDDDGAPVIVVGGGIAGLTAAFRLHQAGCRVLVLDRSGPEEIGGRMATVHQGGFHINTGALLLPRSYRHVLRLAEQVGAAKEILTAGRIAGVFRDGAIHPIPLEPKTATVKSRLIRSLRATDLAKIAVDFSRMRRKLRWHDLTRAAPHDFGTIHDYCRRRGLRADVRDYLLALFPSGLALTEADETSIVTAFFLINAIMACSGGFTSATGVGFLPRALATRLTVLHGAQVTSVEARRQEASVTWTDHDGGERVRSAAAVVLAVPLPQAAGLCPALPEQLRDYFTRVRYARSVHVAFGLDRATAERAATLHIPRTGSTMVAYGLEHNQARGRVRDGTGLVMAYMRGHWSGANWESDDDEVVHHALAETRGLGILPELDSHITTTRVGRVRQATVMRGPGEYRHVARIAPLLREQAPLHFAGSDYLGQSCVNGALVSGERAAADVLDALRRSGRVPLPSR
ncbi:protoporphyrinogen/coproporphyrinogen oxidase [Actinokineospora sp. G85]|uniref:protoporphyrinogen/coproporphyrinogen oxidase n=1 Tax=Actinokineospora sp. G85 TaxID=3406626 RepID=UPI003C765D6A